MKGNNSPGEAKRAKNDEFCARLEDISRELSRCSPRLGGKAVLCNCGDPRASNFFKRFMLLFGALKLKRLIATCRKSQDDGLFPERAPMTIELFPRIEAGELKGDGDF